MAPVSEGMNVGEVRQLAKDLTGVAQQIDTIIAELARRIPATTWVGKDSRDFKGPWWEGHRKSLRKVVDDLNGYSRSASRNADEQERASGGGHADGPGASPPAAAAAPAADHPTPAPPPPSNREQLHERHAALAREHAVVQSEHENAERHLSALREQRAMVEDELREAASTKAFPSNNIADPEAVRAATSGLHDLDVQIDHEATLASALAAREMALQGRMEEVAELERSLPPEP